RPVRRKSLLRRLPRRPTWARRCNSEYGWKKKDGVSTSSFFYGAVGPEFIFSFRIIRKNRSGIDLFSGRFRRAFPYLFFVAMLLVPGFVSRPVRICFSDAWRFCLLKLIPLLGIPRAVVILVRNGFTTLTRSKSP
uniref:hypothetical protein n=2 Tax=Alistipes putredinis TaxID=28117 RepID=UPI003FD7305F